MSGPAFGGLLFSADGPESIQDLNMGFLASFEDAASEDIRWTGVRELIDENFLLG